MTIACCEHCDRPINEFVDRFGKRELRPSYGMSPAEVLRVLEAMERVEFLFGWREDIRILRAECERIFASVFGRVFICSGSGTVYIEVRQ